ncbi:MFS transporter [Vallitalea okinawensis]|uniref:MFS transporter n=1 Tax=Vallitalea okinawensis TaxID=2078660 RepID=UPI000CFB27E8|nr:MFS transporter [Vallitalea okinawensis]
MNFKVLKNKNFLFYLIGNNTSIFGDIMLTTAFSLYVLVLTQSALQFSSVMAVSFIPRIFLSPFAGIAVDRMKKKHLIIVLDIIRALLLLTLFMIALTSGIKLYMIYVVIIFFAICDTLFGPAITTIFPLILEKALISEANAMSRTITNIISVVSPLAGSILFGVYGLPIILLVDGLTFFFSAVFEYFMVFEDHVKTGHLNIGKDIKEGIAVILHDTQLKSLVINGNLTHLFLFPFMEVCVIYLLVMVFRAPEYHYGIVRSCISAGAIIAGFLALYYRSRRTVAQNINYGIIGMICAVGVFSLLAIPVFSSFIAGHFWSPVAYLSAASFIMFLSFDFYGVFFCSFYQTEVSQDKLGRFTSILIMTFSLSRIIGMFAYGYLIENDQLLLVFGLLLVGMILKLAVHVPFMRHESRLASQEEIGH